MNTSAEVLTGAFPLEQTGVLPETWQDVYCKEFQSATQALLPNITGLAEQVFTTPIAEADEVIQTLRSDIAEVAVHELVSRHLTANLATRYGQLSTDISVRARELSIIAGYADELMGRLGLDAEAARTKLIASAADAMEGRAGLIPLLDSFKRRGDRENFSESLAAAFSGTLAAEAGEKLSRFSDTGSRSAQTIDTALSKITEAMVQTGSVMERERAIDRNMGILRQAVSDYLFKQNKRFHLTEPYERLAVMMGHLAAERRLPRGMRMSMNISELYDAFFPPVKNNSVRTILFTYRSSPQSAGRMVMTRSDRISGGDKGPRKPDWKRITETAALLVFVGSPILAACAPQTGATPETQPPTPKPTDSPVVPTATTEILASPIPDIGSMSGLAPLTNVADIVHAVPGLAPALVSPDAQIVKNSDALQKTLNNQGWLPVESQGILAAFVRNGQNALCSISPLETMVDPSRAIDPATGQLIGDKVLSDMNGVLTFGNTDGAPTWKVPRIVSLPDNLPDGVSCLAAVNKTDARLSVLIIDSQNTVLGEAGIVFTPDQDVQVQNINGQPKLIVDGHSVEFMTSKGEILSFAMPTPTLSPKPTLSPTPKRTPEPTATPKPDMAVVLSQVASEAGITFPAEVTTTYEDPSGKFGGSISFSQALAKAAGFKDTEMPDWFIRRILLDVFGNIAYAQLNNNPKYDAFNVLVPDSRSDLGKFSGDPRYVTLMEEVFQKSRLTVQINTVDYQDYAAKVGTGPITIKDIHLHFIKMSEFDALQTAFDQNHIMYAKVHTDGWYRMQGVQRRALVVIDNGIIHLFGYENGRLEAAVSDSKPMERLKNGSDFQRLVAFEEQIASVEGWFGLLFLSPRHPMVISVGDNINLSLMCTESLDDIDQHANSNKVCTPLADGMFR